MPKKLIITFVIILFVLLAWIARIPLADYYYKKGLEYKQEELYNEAGRYFSIAVTLRRGFNEARFEQAINEMSLENNAGAVLLFSEIIKR